MTIAEYSQAELTDQPARLTWRCSQPDLWVGVDLRGRPAGIIVQQRRRLFVATAVTGRSLGQHESLELAQTALEQHAMPQSAGMPLPA